jgi:di/tricarboxylate transporter
VTLPQGLSFAVIGLLVLLFVWNRFRYDVVALIGLVVAVGVGIIPADHAFSGFGNPLLPLVIVMAPIAAGLAARLGFHADAFLMAVAVGAGSDFLTPIGHQCNTLVMGPGGYRFGDLLAARPADVRHRRALRYAAHRRNLAAYLRARPKRLG